MLVKKNIISLTLLFGLIFLSRCNLNDSITEITKVKCQVIEKKFLDKQGNSTDKSGNHYGKDIYIRLDENDYFIKFCESQVKYEEIIKLVNKEVFLELRFLEGDWDICFESNQVQSRIGKYVTINKVLSSD